MTGTIQLLPTPLQWRPRSAADQDEIDVGRVGMISVAVNRTERGCS
jgi:hypothetical protein